MKKNVKNNIRILYNLDAFVEDGFNKEGLDRNGYNRKRVDGYGYISNKELACKEKLKQAITENPNIYQYTTLRLKHSVDVAIFFYEQGGSFFSISKHLRKNKNVVMKAVEINSNSLQYIGKNLRDADDIFKIAFQQNEEILRYASERLRKINIQSYIYRTHFLLTIFF